MLYVCNALEGAVTWLQSAITHTASLWTWQHQNFSCQLSFNKNSKKKIVEYNYNFTFSVVPCNFQKRCRASETLIQSTIHPLWCPGKISVLSLFIKHFVAFLLFVLMAELRGGGGGNLSQLHTLITSVMPACRGRCWKSRHPIVCCLHSVRPLCVYKQWTGIWLDVVGTVVRVCVRVCVLVCV